MGRRRDTEEREPIPGDGADCPVVALGKRGGKYYFLVPPGEILELAPRDMTANGLVSLFGGDPKWLLEHYGKRDKNDRPTGEFDVTAAAWGMMRRCSGVGLYRLDTPKRSIGVWRDEELGGIVAHCGDAMVYFLCQRGKWQRKRSVAGVHRGDAIYLAAPPIDPPDEIAATEDEAKLLLERIATIWRYQAAHLPVCVMGFTATGMLGQAPDWRSHIMLTGEAGSGKSTLLKVVRAAVGPQGFYTNDPTPASLREQLSGEARTVFYDEANASEDGGDHAGMKAEAIIRLVRSMSDDEGGKSQRGTGGSSAVREYTVAGSVALAAAEPPIMDEQDRRRILDVSLLPADPKTESAAKTAIREAEALSPRLRARALQGWERFKENLAVYRQALIKAKCSTAQADQLGTLFAGASMMTSDRPVEPAAAEDEIADLAETIEDYRELNEELSRARRCYGALTGAEIEHWRGGAKSTLWRIIESGYLDPEIRRDVLPIYGVRLELQADDDTWELWVANLHPRLEKIFDRTPWRKGAWSRALKGLPGALACGPHQSQRFAGPKQRFTVIPQAHLPDRPRKPADGWPKGLARPPGPPGPP
jgi:energy-coupling factor transporter ATP-binding protein EcfA2